jgi:BirA family biotin operon repressor/biotin-[acetyl-CoA-carboxylase] ligase
MTANASFWDFGDSLPTFSKPYLQWRLTTEYVGRRFSYMPRVESTMDFARRLVERGMPSGTVAAAEQQLAGRGRAGRSWVSPPEVNLYFTLILYPEPAAVRPLAYVTPLAVAEAVEEVAAVSGAPLRADLKWPNDVLAGRRKLSGVLIETDSGPRGLVALVGVGINVNLDPEEHAEVREVATSIKDQTGVVVSREEVLAAFCNHFESLYEEAISGSRRPFQEWRSRLVTLGQAVTAYLPDGRVDGLAADVAEDGALLIDVPERGRLRIEAGDVVPRGN